MSNELKPCPLCGGKAESNVPLFSVISCSVCHAGADSAEKWNRRAESPAVRGLVEALEMMLDLEQNCLIDYNKYGITRNSDIEMKCVDALAAYRKEQGE